MLVCNAPLLQVAQLLKRSSSTVVFTGAGMSTESGIPDFRSRSGWWKQIDPRTVATVEALQHHYELFHELYSRRIRALQDIEPHEEHKVLAEWEEKGLVHLIATQNVDRLHQQAGSQHVEELHGSITSIRCHRCEQEGTVEQFLKSECCNDCGGNLRPGVVLFGEALPEEAWNNSFQYIKNANLVIVIGTSLEVYPANELPFSTKGKTVLINLDESESEFDVKITGMAKDTLKKINDGLQLD